MYFDNAIARALEVRKGLPFTGLTIKQKRDFLRAYIENIGLNKERILTEVSNLQDHRNIIPDFSSKEIEAEIGKLIGRLETYLRALDEEPEFVFQTGINMARVPCDWIALVGASNYFIDEGPHGAGLLNAILAGTPGVAKSASHLYEFDVFFSGIVQVSLERAEIDTDFYQVVHLQREYAEEFYAQAPGVHFIGSEEVAQLIAGYRRSSSHAIYQVGGYNIGLIDVGGEMLAAKTVASAMKGRMMLSCSAFSGLIAMDPSVDLDLFKSTLMDEIDEDDFARHPSDRYLQDLLRQKDFHTNRGGKAYSAISGDSAENREFAWGIRPALIEMTHGEFSLLKRPPELFGLLISLVGAPSEFGELLDSLPSGKTACVFGPDGYSISTELKDALARRYGRIHTNSSPSTPDVTKHGIEKVYHGGPGQANTVDPLVFSRQVATHD